MVNTTPEVIAQQFERAGQNEKAIAYWQKAAERDLRRFAIKESIAHYANALRLIMALPDTPERSSLELSACLGLGLVQLIASGPTAKEVGEYYQRALTLTHALPGRGRDRFLASWGVWLHQTMTRRTMDAVRLADGLVAIARELDDPDLLLEAYHAQTPELLWQADLLGAKQAAREVIRLYDRERHRDHAYYFGGHDARVCALSFDAMTFWGLGFPDQAAKAVWRCIEDARALGHTFSLAHGLNMGSLTLLLLGDVEACQAVADELYPFAERNKFPWPLAQARFLRGWLASQQGDHDSGIEQMRQVVAEPSTGVMRPVLLAHVAEEELRAGRIADAIGTLEQAADQLRFGQTFFYEPEVVRWRGEALLAQSRDNGAEAEAAFRRAMTDAGQQSFRAIELRAGLSLARLLRDGGRKAEARDVLAPVYAAFTEGFERPDLTAAKALLAEIN